jgi:predicted esterase
MEEHHLHVRRTARYHVLGDIRSAKAIWIVVHGYGQLARFFLNNFEDLENDLCIVAPEGLSRFYLDPEHSRVGATWMTREDRLHEIEDHVAYLDQLVAELKRSAPAGIPINALGFSQGVATVARWAIKGKTALKRLVLWAGGIPPELDQKILRAWSSLHVDLVLGDKDEFFKEADLKGMAQRLAAAAIAHKVHSFNGGHTFDRMLLHRIILAEK